MNKMEIIEDLWKSPWTDQLVNNITKGSHLKDDLKSHLFLILCEMPEKKIKQAHEANWLKYLCVNIIKKQFESNTSPFHKEWRKGWGDNEMADISEIEKPDHETIITEINWFIENKLELVDRELFKIYYKMDKYDRYFGELKDTTCEKPISSLRKMEKKLMILTHNGKEMKISRDTISKSLNRSKMLIKKYLKENGLDDLYY
jgi:hypothetical protein